MANNLGFPQSSDELEEWRKQGRTFKDGQWIEPDTGPAGANLGDAGQQIKPGFEKGGETIGAGDLTQGGDFKIEDPEVEQRTITNVNEFRAAQLVSQEEEMKRIAEEAEARKAAFEPAKKSKIDKALQAFGLTKEEKREEKGEEIDFNEREYFTRAKADLAALDAMEESYVKLESQKDAAIAQAQGHVGAGLSLQNRQIQNITNKYNVELNKISSDMKIKAASMARRQGLANEARAFIKDAVDDYVYDKKLAYDNIVAFQEQHADEMEDLEQEYKDILKESEETALAIWEKKEEDALWNGEKIEEYPDIGIELSDTREEVFEKIRIAGGAPDLLSVAEAKSLGVPYGTTRQQAMGITPGTGAGTGQYGLSENQQKGFNNDVKIGKNALEGGKKWGEVWNEIKDKYPSVPNSTIDNALGGGMTMVSADGKSKLEPWGWAKGGAFEQAGAEPKDKWELESDVWSWLGTPEAQALSEEEKANQIRAYGLNPETFDIY